MSAYAMSKERCCYIEDGKQCAAEAAWQLWTGASYDDYTESCVDHAGALIGASPLLNAVSLSEVQS